MAEQTDDATDELPENHIAASGAECPAFVAERAFDGSPADAIHTAQFYKTTDLVGSLGEGSNSIRMVLDLDGGVVVFDDGQTIHRRVFSKPEAAVETFRTTVDATAEEYDSRGLGYEFEYSAGDDSVTFGYVGADDE